jgi:WD40 repeat protein
MMASPALTMECSDQPLDLSFHPSKSALLAAALVDGTVEVHDFQEVVVLDAAVASTKEQTNEEEEIDTIVSSTSVHTQLLPSKNSQSGSKQASCRAVHFSSDGTTLWTGGSAGDMCSLDADRICTFSTSSSPKSVLHRIPDASYGKSPVQVFHELSSHLMVTGDESGGVRVWDTRLLGSSSASSTSKLPAGCVHSWKKHIDYVSGLEHSVDGNTLLASSADCTLSAYDLRMATAGTQKEKQEAVRCSDDQEDELLSIQLMKHGKKVVCGTGEGVLAVWSFGTWGDVSDRFPGHPASVDALLKVDEDTVLTGSSDGLIRAVSIHPDKFLGVLGSHEGFPVEKLQFNADKSYVGSLTHDPVIRLWDARVLREDYDSDDDETKMASAPVAQATSGTLETEQQADSDDDWEDMDDDMEVDSDDGKDSDDSDEEEDDGGGKQGSKLAGRFKTENEKFFEDL